MFACRKLRPMFERFTERARKVVVLAQEEAQHFNHNYIGTEHLLLGLLRLDEGAAARVLSNLDVDPEKVRREVLRRLGEEPELEPLDQVEWEMESEVARNQMLFRGRVEALEIGARVEGQHLTLLVDLDSTYAVRDSDEPSAAMEHDELLDVAVACLEGSELGSVEEGIREAGELILQRFLAVREVTIGATRERALEGRTASSITVTPTFRR